MVVVYRKPGPINSFISDLATELRLLPTQCQTLVVGVLDQKLENNVNVVSSLTDEFNFIQRLSFTTHIHGGILDLIFDNKKDDIEESTWIPTPYSDHLFLSIGI